MKLDILRFLLILIMIHGVAQAQWLPTNATTGNIYYNNGNVGVGTDSPGGKFTISQIGNGWNDGLRINRDATNYLTLTEDVTDIRLKNWGAGGMLFYTSATLALTIANNGNVGIGTPVAYAPLEVRGPGLWDGTIRVNSLANGQYSSIGIFENNARRWAIYNHPGNSSTLFIANKDGDDKISITQDGKMGIGSIVPDAKLTVNGDIHTKEVRVDVDVPGPDYVFENDYNLLSLAELEAYVKANKHLPEVPSAKEMEADGLNLKEMNLLLLKKVEELTLYMIQQNERLELQQRELDVQQKQLEDQKAQIDILTKTRK